MTGNCRTFADEIGEDATARPSMQASWLSLNRIFADGIQMYDEMNTKDIELRNGESGMMLRGTLYLPDVSPVSLSIGCHT